MEITFEFVIYDEEHDKFELDENIYTFSLDDEHKETFKLLQDGDIHLYNWFKDSKHFVDWIKTEVYPDSEGKKIAIATINDILYLRYYFFKITSADVHYDYFKELFGIIAESDWQDREDVGEEILGALKTKRLELLIDLSEEETKSDD